MKKSSISLDAARLIALTAMLGFIDGRYKIEEGDISRSRITLTQVAAAQNQTARTAFLIEMRRGNFSKEILVDAQTGQVLPS